MPRPAWLAIGAAAGALALGLPASPLVLLLGASCALAVSVALHASGRAGPARRAAALGLGVLAIAIRAGATPPPSGPGRLPAGEGPWIAVVHSVGAPRVGARPAVIELQTEPALLVAATLPWYPPVVPSDRVELRGRIRPPPGDDYGGYLARIGAVGTLRADSLALLPAGGSVGATIEAWRRAASDSLARAMPEPEAGLAAGVLIGLRDRVDRDLAADFTTAGASHVVAISGWNIAIVASTLAAVAGGLRRRRRAILTAAAIVLYVAFVGPSPSVVRAGVMAGIALLAREVGRPGTAAGALGWAVTALLVLDPAYIGDAGFRLSVLATAGILAWGSSLTARIAGPDPGRPRRWLAEILGVSLAAQAATTPIVLLDFGRLSLVAPLVNLVVVPLVPPAMAAGAVALGIGMLAGSAVPGGVATLVGLPAWCIYAAMVAAVRAGAGLPMASLQLDSPWDAVAAGLSGCAIVALARWGPALLGWLRRPRPTSHVATAKGPTSRHRSARAGRLAGLSLAGATIALGLSIAYRPDGAVRVTVLDVGQGDAILIEGDRGARMVVDGGPDPGGLLQALDERLPPWDRRLDLMVLTHPHEDHVAGLAIVLSRYRVGQVYESGLPGRGPGYQAWAAAFVGRGRPAHLVTGDHLALDSIRFTVLWPDAGTVPGAPLDDGKAINNTSVVLLGATHGQRFLLTGDMEEDIDPTLVGRGLPRVDLLKVAHHGSRTATTPAFLDATRPGVAVISVGADNDYGHPAPETLERLRARGVPTYRTDLNGSVQVRLDGHSVQVRTERGDAVAAPAEATGARDYHRSRALQFSIACACSRQRPPRLLLGRRRVRPRRGGGGLPRGYRALPRGRARALATGRRAQRTRPPPGRAP
ncbi:MAG TPA: ComEC/Rec2 family competence protein [Patescibacteria group bacterium]|nr:ComEC/Rec2 family competence protein [Patescibacteria group bacterium]